MQVRYQIQRVLEYIEEEYSGMHFDLIDTRNNTILMSVKAKGIVAPQALRDYQARLNTSDMLD